MKTILRTMMVAATVLATVGCGNRTKDQAVAQTVAAETAPSVSVQQVFVKAVPQEATYTSTIQPYIKNNIVLKFDSIIHLIFLSSHKLYLQNLFRPVYYTDLVFQLFLQPPNLY